MKNMAFVRRDNLRYARKATKTCCVKDAISIAFECLPIVLGFISRKSATSLSKAIFLIFGVNSSILRPWSLLDAGALLDPS